MGLIYIQLFTKIINLIIPFVERMFYDKKPDIEKNQIDKLSRQINQDMSVDNNWGQFLKAFESVHPDFAKWVFKKRH